MCIQNNIANEAQKEATAITVMRCMLLKYAEDHQMTFEESMLQFSQSKTYPLLFEYETNVWKEGPDYLRGLYEEELNNKTFLNNSPIETR